MVPLLNRVGGGRGSPKDLESSLPCNCAGRLTGQAVPSVLTVLKMEKKKIKDNYSPTANCLWKDIVNFLLVLSRNTSGVTLGVGKPYCLGAISVAWGFCEMHILKEMEEFQKAHLSPFSEKLFLFCASNINWLVIYS